ncbi:FAD-dependent oxidoreductase [Lactococcus nasutitermitis]|uniref:FAD-dependent oxidoreductase n=1 Tax=Lactococcus nasutitermitis TaxID=1652957 RepID=A0ABV9JDR2_9LACT|nr:FAD-dependent oxidoreductase [Lactococcus nasutitermitis]
MRIVIIGGSHAGICTALRALEEYPEAEIVIYEKNERTSFVSQGIISYLAGEKESLFQSSYLSPEEIRATGIHFITESVVSSIDVKEKKLTYYHLGSEELLEDKYDKLVFATGSYPIMPLIPFDNTSEIFFLKGMTDAIAAGKFLEKAKTVAIVGGGMTGLEVARICNQRGIKTTWINAHHHVLSRYLDEASSTLLEKIVSSEGVQVENDCRVTEISKAADNGSLLHTTTKEISVDGVIFALGFQPNTYLLHEQVTLGDRGAILVDEYMQTSVADVFAVGDASTTWVERAGKNFYLPHASDSVRNGEIAAVNLMKARQKINSTQATYHVPMKDMVIALTGQTLAQAKKVGLDALSVQAVNAHLKGHSTSYVWLVYERHTHRIIGLQCIGKTPDLAAYADIISLAIERNLTVEDIEFTDFYFEHGYKDPRGFNRILARLVRGNQEEKQD